jgi:Cu-Zn family superoxide dismutase
MLRTSVLAFAAFLTTSCATTPAPSPHIGATNPIIDTTGARIGTVKTRADPRGWALVVETQGLTPGNHGIHMHEVGRCDAPGFTTAGAHFDPSARNHHGAFNPNPHRPHRGDMGNLLVTPDGKGDWTYIELWNPKIASHGLALVIHAHEDDNKTDPSGNSGERIACGVIFPGQ